MEFYINNDVKKMVIDKDSFNNQTSILLKEITYFEKNFKNSVFIPEDFVDTKLHPQENLREWINRQSKTFKLKIVSMLPRLKKWSKYDDSMQDSYIYAGDNTDNLVNDNALGHCWKRLQNHKEVFCYSIDSDTWYDENISIKELDDNQNIQFERNISNYNYINFEKLNNYCNDLLKDNIESWSELETYAKNNFTLIHICEESFVSMFKYPFSKGVAAQIIRLLNVLQSIEHNTIEGKLNEEGSRIYQDHFNCNNADFSSEDGIFNFDVLLSNGNRSDNANFPFHGKIESHHDPIRMHFTWPKINSEPINIVYVGMKLTKK